jgi:hypothetical protein
MIFDRLKEGKTIYFKMDRHESYQSIMIDQLYILHKTEKEVTMRRTQIEFKIKNSQLKQKTWRLGEITITKKAWDESWSKEHTANERKVNQLKIKMVFGDFE